MQEDFEDIINAWLEGHGNALYRNDSAAITALATLLVAAAD